DVFTYQNTVNRADIGLCPLLDDAWNRRKSAIKAMEYGLAGAAVVASPVLYRDIVQGRGILARSEDDWYPGIETYVIDADRRKRDAKALKEYVVSRWDVRKHVADIYSTYRSLFKGTATHGNQRHQRAAHTGRAGYQ